MKIYNFSLGINEISCYLQCSPLTISWYWCSHSGNLHIGMTLMSKMKCKDLPVNVSVRRDSNTSYVPIRSHPATSSLSQFILYDIIPLCPRSTRKANLFTSLFEKVSFMGSVQESMKRFGSEINWRGTFRRNERDSVIVPNPSPIVSWLQGSFWRGL